MSISLLRKMVGDFELVLGRPRPTTLEQSRSKSEWRTCRKGLEGLVTFVCQNQTFTFGRGSCSALEVVI